MSSSLVSPRVATQAGRTVVQAWLKHYVESGYDFVRAEWSGDGTNWRLLDTYTAENAGYPGWTRITLGFDSPAATCACGSASPPTCTSPRSLTRR